MIAPDGTIDGTLAARTPRVIPDGRTFSYVLHDGAPGTPRITITQNDVRAIQLAKAALYAGVRLLMDHLGVEHIDEIRLAGAFGSQIDVFHAMVLGLIPDADLAHVSSAGNAAGTGALIALLSAASRREIEAVVRTVEKIETAVEPRFQEHFVDAMAFPHRRRDKLRPQCLSDLKRRRLIWLNHNLRDSVPIPQVDEDQPAMISPRINPTTQRDFFANVPDPQFTARMSP